MDIELLRTFLELNRTRHFGEAAEALHLTQAAVSARIKNLETVLGVKLFERLKRDLRLTPEGHRLLRYADMLISGWRKARQDVSAGGAAQQLTIGGSVRLWDVVLKDWFIQLRRNMPEVAIIAESHTPDLLTRRLLDGLLDVAFMLEPAQLDIFQVQKVALMQLVLVSSEPEQSVEQALGEGYLMVDWGLAHAVEHRRMYPDAAEPHVRTGQASIALAHLLSIGGSAYLPARMVADDIATGQLQMVESARTIELEVYAVFAVRSARTKLIKKVLQLFEYKVDLDELKEH
ncbi:MAG: LysR family transcriptional regulator [Gammaproteobacteria bacterium]|nr:LysR family transcriptional regulator [Gammaproteobacteria bacterium]MBL6998941.1 LysR family transcriptional regulator [Gammaproteobacteria bacterium]